MKEANCPFPTRGCPKVQTWPSLKLLDTCTAQIMDKAPPKLWPVTWTDWTPYLAVRILRLFQTKASTMLQDYKNPEWIIQLAQPEQGTNEIFRFWIQFLVSTDPLKATTNDFDDGLQPTKLWISAVVFSNTLMSVSFTLPHREQFQAWISAALEQAMSAMQAKTLASEGVQA